MRMEPGRYSDQGEPFLGCTPRVRIAHCVLRTTSKEGPTIRTGSYLPGVVAPDDEVRLVKLVLAQLHRLRYLSWRGGGTMDR